MATPSVLRHAIVDQQSALDAKLEIRLVPLAIAANIAARCEMDLSPGNEIAPEIVLARVIFTQLILGIFSSIVLTVRHTNLYLTIN
jgi:hypothetical protein